MLKALVRNTLFSGVAFFAVGLINLLVIPITINGYGLQTWGLLVLLRVLLPTGFFAILDFGVPEIATLLVARARTRGDWAIVSRQLSTLLLLACGVGLTLAALFFVGADLAATRFHVDADGYSSFVQLTRVTGIALIVLYPGLLVEGVVKGFERYGLLRLIEVLTVTMYAGVTLYAVKARWPWSSVAYAYLLAIIAKYVAFAFCIRSSVHDAQLRLVLPDRQGRREVFERAGLMFQSKVLGAAQLAPPLFIGVLVGAPGVAIYDVLVRLPRFVKAVLALLNSAVLPVSTRLDEEADRLRLRSLGQAGLWLFPAIAFPGVIGAAAFSPSLLREWLGPALVAYWPWLAVMFVLPLLGILLTFGQTIMQTRTRFLAINNVLGTVQVVTQFAISLLLVRALQERAFVLGQVAALVAIFPVQMRLILSAQGFDAGVIWRLFAKHLLIALPLGTLAMLAQRAGLIDSAWSLAAAFGVWCATYWTALYTLTLSDAQRLHVQRMTRMALGH